MTRKRAPFVVLVLAVAGPVLVLVVEAVMLQAGVGGLSEIAGTLADQDQLQESDASEVLLPTGEAGEAYLRGQIYVRGPIATTIVVIAYSFLVRRWRWFDHALLVLPMALYVSWPLLGTLLWAFALYLVWSVVIGISVRWTFQRLAGRAPGASSSAKAPVP